MARVRNLVKVLLRYFFIIPKIVIQIIYHVVMAILLFKGLNKVISVWAVSQQRF